MYPSFSRFLCVLVMTLLGLGCASDDQRARDLLYEAKRLVRDGQSEEGSSLKDERSTRLALEYYTDAAAHLQKIKSDYPQTELAKALSESNVDLGGISVTVLLEDLLPAANRQMKAFHDPLYAAWLLANRSKDIAGRARTLVHLAQVLAHRTKRDDAHRIQAEATHAILQIADMQKQVELLCALAQSVFENGDLRGALDLAFNALGVAKRIEDSESRATALGIVATTYYILHVDQRGFEALQSVPKDQQTEVIRRVTTDLIERKQSDAAANAATVPLAPEIRAPVLLTVAAKLVEAGDRDAAVTAARDAEHALQSISGNNKFELLLQYEALLRQLGQRDDALSTLTQAADLLPGRGSSAYPQLVELALRYATNEDFQSAARFLNNVLESIRRPGTSSLNDDQLLKVIQATAASKLNSKADELAKMLHSPRTRVLAQLTIASQSLRLKIPDRSQSALQRARALISSVPIEERTPLRISLRDLFLEANDLAQAQEVALDLKGEERRWRSYVKGFQAALLKSGHGQEAIALARGIDEPYLRAVLLAEAAKDRVSPNTTNEAASLLDEAAKILDETKDSAKKAAMAAYLADVMLQIRWPRLAEDVVSGAALQDKSIWYCRIAEGYASQAQAQPALAALKVALNEARSLIQDEDRARVLLEVARVQQLSAIELGSEFTPAISALLTSPSDDATSR